MPNTAQKALLKDVAIKQDTGDLSSPTPVGATFANVVDSRASKGNYTLQQFFDSYMAYMQAADFTYYGAEKPSNPHIRIWIDTSTTNQA